MNIVTTYDVIACFSCGSLFAVPESVNDEWLRSGRSFYCPNGHSQHYTESTEKRLQAAKDRAARLAASLDQERAAHDATERSRRAIKGQVTRVKRRVANGVCPCCSRSFADLHAHMTTKHPDYASADV